MQQTNSPTAEETIPKPTTDAKFEPKTAITTPQPQQPISKPQSPQNSLGSAEGVMVNTPSTSTPSPKLLAEKPKIASPISEVRSNASPTPPTSVVKSFNRQTDSPRSIENATPPLRVSESPFRNVQQQQQQQQRVAPAVSPLAAVQQTSPPTVSPAPGAQTVPWRSQRNQTPQPSAPIPVAQSHPQQQQQQQAQAMFNNNVQQQKPADYSTQQQQQYAPYQGPKPVCLQIEN